MPVNNPPSVMHQAMRLLLSEGLDAGALPPEDPRGLINRAQRPPQCFEVVRGDVRLVWTAHDETDQVVIEAFKPGRGGWSRTSGVADHFQAAEALAGKLRSMLGLGCSD